MAAFNFDQFLAQEGDAPTKQNTGFDFDTFLAEETGQPTWGNAAKRGIADSLKVLNPLGIQVDQQGVSFNPIGSEAMTDPAVQKKLAPWMPAIGGTVGMAFGPVGVAAGTGLGAIAENAMKIEQGDPNAPTTPWGAARYAMTQTALAGAPEASNVLKAVPGAKSYGERATSYVADKLGNLAIGAGRRALGFTKQLLKDKVGQEAGTALRKANEAARTMLDEGVIRPFSGASGMKERAMDLADTAEGNIANTISALDKTGAGSIHTGDVVRDVYAQLSPRFSGGAYDTDKKIVEEIVGTIRAHGDGPLTFDSAQLLKNKLQKLGKFQQGGDNVKAELYQRASGIVREALDKAVAKMGVSEVGGEIAPETMQLVADYGKNKANLGRSYDALRALGNRVSSEEGNRLISGTDFVAGAGAAAREDIPVEKLPEKLGILLMAKRGIERYGGSTAAWTYKRAADIIHNNAYAVNHARRAIISRIVSKENQ